MVKTRRNPFDKSEERAVSLKILRSARNHRHQAETESDESGFGTRPFRKRKRLRSADNHGELADQKSDFAQSDFSPPKTRLRSGRSHPHTDDSRRSSNHVLGRGKRGRQRIEAAESRQGRENKDVPEVRRSHRKGRQVFETLNVNFLTQNKFSRDWLEISKNQKKRKEQREVCDDVLNESELARNMYDKIKSRHTPTSSPIKCQQNVSYDDDDEDVEDEEEEEDDDEEEEENSDEDDVEENNSQSRRYLLRKKKPVTNRYKALPIKSKRERKTSFRGITGFRRCHHQTPPHTSPIRRKYRHRKKVLNNSSTSSSSGDDGCGEDDDDQKFERRKSKSMAKARSRCLPMNFAPQDLAGGVLKDREKIGSSLADIDPMNIDHKVKFDSVGGLGKEIRSLKEMILFPLMYPEVFERFKVQPPRGVLFHGPPGTGKTLVARALANECSQGDKKVAFFMRKGADCLSKWVGESERQLRLLFDQAFSMRPSIIFFDEIDGLAPVRSSRQDQIHSSIVSTLLALMDGLDSRGEIVVIGATNRIDAIDPALRRPGRFDREFRFPLPDKNSRRHILQIHTKDWEPKLSQAFISEVADTCVGYCGADIKALCTEAALFALRRRYPQIYSSSRKLLLDVNSIEVTAKDFLGAMKTIVPASQRAVVSPGRGLSPLVKPLLQSVLEKAMILLHKVFPPAQVKSAHESLPSGLMGNAGTKQQQKCMTVALLSDDSSSSDEGPNIFEPRAESARSARYMRRTQQRFDEPEPAQTEMSFLNFLGNSLATPGTYRPRLLVCGCEGMGQSTHLAPALLHSMEHLTVHCLDLPALYGVTSRTPEEACSQIFREARRSAPCILYMPHMNKLWNASGESVRATFMSLLQDLPPLAQVLLLATCNVGIRDLPFILQYIFSEKTGQIIMMKMPTDSERRLFFKNLLLGLALRPPRPSKSGKEKTLEVLPFAPSPQQRQLSERELKKVRQDEENTMRELRIFLRDVHSKLLNDRRFKEFSKPVDLEDVPDYFDVVKEPMDLSTMMQRIDCHRYGTCAQYLTDVELITSNALKYNPDVDPLDKIIRHRACELKDLAHSLIYSQLEPEFEKACEEILTSRERRGEQPCPVAPAYIFTNLANRNRISKTPAEISTTMLQTNADNDAREHDAATEENGETVGNHIKCSPKSKSKKKFRGFGARRRSKKGNFKRKLINKLNTGKGETVDGDDTEERSEREDDKHEEMDGDTTVRTEDENTSKEDNETNSDSQVQTCNENAVDSVLKENDTPSSEMENYVDKSVLPNGIDSHGLSEDTEQGLSIDKEDCVSVSASEICNYDDDDVAVLSDIDTPIKNVDEKTESGELHQNKEMQRKKHSPKSQPNGVCVTLPSVCAEIESPEPVNMETDKDLLLTETEENYRVDKDVACDDLEGISELKNSCRQERRKANSCVTDECRLKMEQLLSRLVEVTCNVSIETLERYHNVLHHCVHEHRRDLDKTEMMKELEELIEGFVQSRSCR